MSKSPSPAVEPDWIEVSLTVDGELAEAVAEVLRRFAAGGVAIESTGIASETDGPGTATGPLRVLGYLPADPGLVETRQRLEEALWYLGRIQPLPEANFRLIQGEDWTQAWKASYQPVLIGRRLAIIPAWLERPPGDLIPIFIEPGMAFGTGTHPTTQLCLEWIEAQVHPGLDVIDVGCGSGILAIAALKLGAGQALGVDTDPDAIAIARENGLRNNVEASLALGLGSVEAILSGQYPLSRAPLVLANILAPTLGRLLEQGLARLLTPGGLLILSGILEEQEAALARKAAAHGLVVEQRRQMGDWVALGARPA